MIIALALCLVMVLGISATAFAQDPQIQLGTAGKITKDNVSLRKAAGLSSTILGQVNSGDKCWYQGYGGYADTYDWHKVFMGSGNCSGQTGYVASSLVYWGT